MINIIQTSIVCLTVLIAILLLYKLIQGILQKQYDLKVMYDLCKETDAQTKTKPNLEAQKKMDDEFQKQQTEVYDLAREIQKLFLNDSQIMEDNVK